MKTDIIIAGAGPTGLSLACQLIRHNVDFVILDKKEGITPYSKAIGVQARTLEIYEQINLAQTAIEQGAVAEKVRLIEAGEIRGEVELSSIGEGLSPYPFLLILEQSKHEQILYDFIKAHGKDILWQTELENFSQNDEGISANIKNASGATETIEAKYLVGCDGAKSSVRHTLGLEFAGSTFERIFYVADVAIDWKFGHNAVQICLAQNALTAFFPMPGEKRYRIVGTFPEEFSKDEGDVLYDEIERQIKEDTKIELDIKSVNWFSTYKVHTRRVNRFSVGRCFVAGDAAHVHSPAGAQGMNTGIQDAYNLAWKLALVLKKNAGAKLLETYDEERGENAKHLLETTDRLFQFGTSDNLIIAYLRTHVFPYLANSVLSFDSVKKVIFPRISQIGIHYRKSSLSEKGNANFSVKAGDRMPYFLVEGESIYNSLHEAKFHLLIFRSGKDKQTIFENKYADLVDVHEAPLYPHIAEIFGAKESFIVLLRPDNYIGFISSADSLEDLEDYLIKVVRLPVS
ncbi:MAG: FAD-dependent monooxygenase [Acidobacteriota bacterium]|nr:FAD-dependent monooxygenase [Acidobacteriota bacterium]